MTILFVGGERESLQTSSASVAESTTSGTFDTTFCRCSMALGETASADYVSIPALATNQTEVWLHFEHTVYGNLQATSTAAHAWITFFRDAAAAQPIFALYTTGHNTSVGSTTIQVRYYNGSAWVDVGTTFTIGRGSLVRWDIHLTCVPAGTSTAELYQNGVVHSSYSWAHTYTTEVATIRLGKASYSYTVASHVSQIILATTDTRGMRLATIRPTGAGTYTEGSGTYSDFAETVLNDASGWTSGTADEKYSWTFADMTQSMSIRAVVLSSRVSRSDTGPQVMRGFMRADGADTFFADYTLTTNLESKQTIMETNPATSAAWGMASGINGFEFGFQSRT